MKKLFNLILPILYCQISLAQWSTPVNNFMSTPNVLSINNGGYAHIQLGDDAATGFIFSKEISDNSFNIWTGPSSQAVIRFRITNGGDTYIGNRLGIGTMAPAAPFHINNNNYAAMLLGNNDATGFVITKEATDNSFNIWSGPFGTGSVNRMKINGSNGNVGIGNIDPQYRLDLYGDRALDGMRLVYKNSGYVLMHPNSLAAGAYNPITQSGDAGIVYGDYNFTGGASTSYGFIMVPWKNTEGGLRMDQYGNVGIWVADTKGYQLAVNGQAIFNRIVVKQYPNWSDYVFDSAYKLQPLAQVEQYIKANHHLPEIPSADSVAKAGIDVGANQAALLKKVEELTLYMIQLNETVEQQQEKIRQLEERLSGQGKKDK